MTTTLIRNADVAIVWDAGAKQHTYLPGADIAFEEGKLTFVGRDYSGTADETISGSGLMVMPGLVNIHSTRHRSP